MVEFCFPNAHQRAKILAEDVFSSNPNKGFRLAKARTIQLLLERWIYNIALNATFLAAEDANHLLCFPLPMIIAIKILPSIHCDNFLT